MVTNTAYVDGSYYNDKVGAAYILYNSKGVKFLGQFALDNSSGMRNVMGEIYAAQKVVEKAISLNMKSIKVIYDYEGIEKWVMGKWRAKKMWTEKYRDIMRKYMKQINITFEKVKSHSGHKLNDRVDLLAKGALKLEVLKKY